MCLQTWWDWLAATKNSFLVLLHLCEASCRSDHLTLPFHHHLHPPVLGSQQQTPLQPQQHLPEGHLLVYSHHHGLPGLHRLANVTLMIQDSRPEGFVIVMRYSFCVRDIFQLQSLQISNISRRRKLPFNKNLRDISNKINICCQFQLKKLGMFCFIDT